MKTSKNSKCYIYKLAKMGLVDENKDLIFATF